MKKKKKSFLASKIETEDVWIVDSGTTTNMTNKCDRIKNYKKINTEIDVAKINESMSATGWYDKV